MPSADMDSPLLVMRNSQGRGFQRIRCVERPQQLSTWERMGVIQLKPAEAVKYQADRDVILKEKVTIKSVSHTSGSS